MGTRRRSERSGNACHLLTCSRSVGAATRTRQRLRLERRELERHASIARRPSDAMPPAPSGATSMEHREQPGDTVGGGSDGDELSAGAAVLDTAGVAECEAGGGATKSAATTTHSFAS